MSLLSTGSRLDAPRHQTLRAVIYWSYALLSHAEQRLFLRLAVFAGGWDLEALEPVCGAGGLDAAALLDLLVALVEKSLVTADESGEKMRYRLLETMREYASERSNQSGQTDETRRRHAAYYRALAEQGSATRRGVHYAEDLDVLRREHDNMRAALSNLLALGDVDDGLSLCYGLSGFWLSQGYLAEGEEWIARFLAHADRAQWAIVAQALYAAGRMYEYHGSFDRARTSHQRSLSIAQQHDDAGHVARALFGLESAEVDALVIATPHHLLAPVALTGVRAGKHVLVEKPMGLDEQEGKEVEFAAASNGVSCMIGYSFRFSMGRYVHDLLAAGAVGEIQAITGSIGTGPMNRGWMAASDTGGGPLLYVGCHLIEFVLWFTGDEPASVFAQVQRHTETGTDETSAVQIRLRGGGGAQLHVTQAAPSFFYDLHVYGRSCSRAQSRKQQRPQPAR